MSMADKEAELGFHFDRMRESTLIFIKSVLQNPLLTPEEQVVLLKTLAEKHTAIGQYVSSELDHAFLNIIEQHKRPQPPAL